MAGESPDRSKQRESSAEPTSGSTGPVPESTPTPTPTERPDPRLAMTRETPAPTAPQGGVDTATRMLTRRELEVVRARLAEAEGAEGASAEAESAGAEAGGAAGAGAGSRGAEGEDVVVGGVRGASAETGAESGDSGDAVAGGSEGASAAGSAGDVKADSADAVAGDSEDASADAGADSVDSAEGSQDAEAQGDQGTAAGDDRLRAAVAAWVASTDAKGDKPVPGADEGAEASDEADEADDAAVASGADARGDADAGTASKADSSAEGEAEASGTATDAEPAEASSDGGETSAASSDADEPAEASGDSDKTSAASGDADGADAAPKPPAAEGADTAEDTAEAGEAAKGVGAAETPAADGTPKGDTPADGEAAPPGPPAPDDESGTGGAGGNTKAEGGAEAVDQATAVFRAVRPTPTKPPVDHPTTTLKAPKPAAETPAERTSKFVALKPDIRYDTPKAPEAPKAPAVPKAPTPDVTAAIPQVGPERTAQQPLPPRPPLDLLAELTNTPPPPDTPVRTALRRVKIWTPLVLLLAIIFAIAQAVRPLPTPTLALTAEESYTFDGSKVSLPWPGEGQGWMDVNGIGTMGDFGKQTPVAIGSVAKAMTAYVVLKDHALKTGEDGEKIEVDALAEKEGGYDQDGESTLNTVKQGDTITLRDAIAAIMIPSANNIARLLARWDAGSEKAFIEKMNAAAKELGMTNTTYTDASGLKESTVSTAEDQVKLGNELVRIPALMEITSMGQWIDPSGQKWYNYNYLVPYNGAIGIKTGTTTAAGGNLLFAARKEVGGETVTLVGAILGQHKAPIIQTVNDVSKVAMLAAQDELNSAKILKKGDVVGYVDDGLGGSTPVVLTKDVTAVGWAGFKVKLSFDADDVPHTAKAGTKVGTLTVGDGTDGAVKVPVALQSDLAEPGFTDKLTRIG
ncbi:D-alanyl-D-alanine carboxypeptidase [Streptomyces sp. cf386]|nr:D-alanyl-D-alanine carboxypeptidase [Streptomyces sp. cf386]